MTVKYYSKAYYLNFLFVNFPFIYTYNNIPAAPVYRSQLIRNSRACGYYNDFLDRGLLLARNLLDQGFLVVKGEVVASKVLRSPP